MSDIPLSFRRAGSRALLVEVDDVASARAVYRAVVQYDGSAPPPRDVVPAARTVLIDGVDPQTWQDYLASVEISATDAVAGQEVVVPVRYDGADLAEVAEALGLLGRRGGRSAHRDRVRRRVLRLRARLRLLHRDRRPLPTMPRRAEPRSRVPAGSVALAGEYCGVYPSEMPGGWQLIGTHRRGPVRLCATEAGAAAARRPGSVRGSAMSRLHVARARRPHDACRTWAGPG